MSKKSFSTAPRPKQLTSEAIDAFVQGGSGHDTGEKRPQNTAASSGPVKRLSIDLPEESHRRFKVACAATGRKMASELVGFIEKRTAELEEEVSK